MSLVPEVYFFDTRCPEYGLKKGPPISMPNPCEREFLASRVWAFFAAIVQIYVLGGHKNSYRDGDTTTTSIRCMKHGTLIWIRLFGSAQESVEDYPASQESMKGWCAFHAAVDNGVRKMIFVSIAGEIGEEFYCYCYDLERESWSMMDKDFHFGSETPSIVVDNIIYCFSRKLRAYDLVERRWYKKSVRGLDGEGVSPYLQYHNGYGSPEYNYPEVFLADVGNGKLCLVWSNTNNIHCTKFRVTKFSDGGDESELRATIESFNVYTTNCGRSIKDRLTV